MTGVVSWEQLLFIAGVIGASVMVGVGFALWLKGALGEMGKDLGGRIDAVKQSVHDLEVKVVGEFARKEEISEVHRRIDDLQVERARRAF